MTKPPEPDTDYLVQQAAAGDRSARHQLLDRHRARLRHAVALRLDRRLAARLDPSDIVQETLAEAAAGLSDYLRQQPLPFYPWLRRLAGQKLIDAHRRHLQADRRSVRREQAWTTALPDDSARKLIDRLFTHGTEASQALLRNEVQDQVRRALARLEPRDREVLVLRSLEQLSTAEAAAVLGLSAEAVRSRHRRALERLSDLLGDYLSWGGPP